MRLLTWPMLNLTPFGLNLSKPLRSPPSTISGRTEHLRVSAITGKRFQRWRVVAGNLLWLATLPLPAQALSPAEVDHLMQRAAFAAAPADYTRMAALSREQAVDLLLQDAAADELAPAMPDWAHPPWTPDYWQHHPLHETPKRATPMYWAATRRWFLNGLLSAPSPLRARMALHWHEFFPLVRQKHAASAVRRDAKFYAMALGDYRDLLTTFSRDGVTMENLDMKQNRRGAINENFARELLELYTLGRGHYTQNDIHETARAFTGWAVHRTSGVFVVMWNWHDFGPKTILGQTARFDGDDVLEILFQHPRFAEFQVERLWTTFISPDPDRKRIQQWAMQFRQQDYSLTALLRTMLTSEDFWAAANRQSLVKSPVELVVGALRAEGVSGDYGEWINLWATQMGQRVYLAPDVKGWRGYTSWLTTGTIGVRQAFLNGMAGGFDASVLSRFDAATAYPEFYPLERAHGDSARLWRAVEEARSQRGKRAPAMMMAMKDGGETAAEPTRNLK